MNPIKAKGIVVRTTDYKDYDRLVTILTDSLGKITVQMKGCRKPTARLRYASIPMFFGEYILNESGGRYIVTGCDTIEPFYDISLDIDAYYSACAIMQTAERISLEGEDTAIILSILLKSLLVLKDKTSPHYEVVIKFIDELTRAGGYSVGMTTCRQCGDIVNVGVLSDEGVVCSDCGAHTLGRATPDSFVMAYIDEVLREVPHSRVVTRDLVRRAIEYSIEYLQRLVGVTISALNEYLKVFTI